MLYVEFTLSEAMEQFLSCHRHALEFFGGGVQKVMIDTVRPIKNPSICSRRKSRCSSPCRSCPMIAP